jgi:hypothetical protein
LLSGGTPVDRVGVTLGTSTMDAQGTRGGNSSISTSSRGGSWKSAGEAALVLAGSLAGGQIGNNNSPYKDANFAQEGASIGAMIGTMTPLGPVGGAIGGVLGGLVGGLLKKNVEDGEKQITALELIERNTRQQIQAVENQTRMLQLDSRFMNVPTGFVVPTFRPFGANSSSSGGNVSMNITVNAAPGQDEQKVAALVADAIRNELRGAGRAFDIRR